MRHVRAAGGLEETLHRHFDISPKATNGLKRSSWIERRAFAGVVFGSSIPRAPAEQARIRDAGTLRALADRKKDFDIPQSIADALDVDGHLRDR